MIWADYMHSCTYSGKLKVGLLVLGAPRYTVSPEWFDELKGFCASSQW